MLTLHPPTSAALQGEISDADRERLRRLVLNAVTNALEHAAADTAGVRLGAPTAPIPANATDRLDRESGTYRMPSFGDGSGEGVDVPVRPPRVSAEEEQPAGPSLEHPHVAAELDEVWSTPSRFEGETVALLSVDRVVRVASPRYAISGALARAVRWGNLLFGTGSYAIYEGPWERSAAKRRYWTLRTDEPVSRRHLRGIAGVAGKPGWFAFGATGWVPLLRFPDHSSFLLRALITREREAVFPPSQPLVEEFWAEMRTSAPGEAIVPEARARAVLFDEIDALVAAGDTEDAAERLAELDAQAFGLVTWEKRSAYLRTLVLAWTREPQERAIIEVIKASASRSELDGTIDLLRSEGLVEQLFDDLDSELFSLLVVVGERFGDSATLTLDELARLMQDVELLPRDWTSVVTGITFGPADVVISADLLAEAYEAARGFVRFLGGILDAIEMVVTRPLELVEGIAQLARLVVAVELAKVGHRPSQVLVERTLQSIGRQVLFGLRGIQVLGIGEHVARRVRWAVVWEIASWFIGVGEVAAVLKGAGFTERLAAFARILGILRRAGRAVDAEVLATRVGRLARALRAESRLFSHEDELLHFIGHLPEEDVGRLGRLLREADIPEGISVAALRQAHPALAEAAGDALRKAEVLKTLAAKAGDLSDEVVEAFSRLTARGRFGLDEAAGIAGAIPDGEFQRFARALDLIPAESLGKASEVSAELLKGIAASPKRMDAVATIGLDTYRSLEWRVGGRLDALDQHLDALAEMEAAFAKTNRRADYRRYLDRLGAGDARAWEHLEDSARRPRGQRKLPVSFDSESEWQRYDAWRRRRLAELERETDPIARQVLDDYRGRTTEELQRLEREGDELARDVLEEKLGKRGQFLPDRRSDPAIQAQLRDELSRFRTEVEAARPEPFQGEPPDWTRTAKPGWSPEPLEAVPTGKQVRRYRGTVGVATSDVPGLDGRVLRGASPQAGGPVGSGGRIAPSPQLAGVPQAHAHAEQDLANQIDRLLTDLSPADSARAYGRTVWFRVDQEVCSTCAAGLRGGREGVLRQLSALHPGIVFEITADDTSRVVRIRGGELIP